MTETLRKSQLAITALWNKHLRVLATFLILISSLSAQELSTGERLRLFNEQFFAAQDLKNRGELDKAQALFLQLYEQDPQNATICYELSQLFARDESSQEAVYYAQEAHRLDPENQWFELLLTAVYKQARMWEALRNHLLNKGDTVDLSLEEQADLAQTYFELGEDKEALEVLDRIEAEQGILPEIIDFKKTIYLQRGELDKAAKELKKLIKIDPQNFEYRGSLGQLYLANGESDKALAVFQQMLEIDSTDPRPHLDLANYFRQQGDFGRCIYHLRSAMASPGMIMDRKIAILLSLFEASQGDSALAAETYAILNEIVAQEPEDARVYALYGDYLSRDGKDQQAIKYYKKALRYQEKFQVWEQILLIEIQNRLFDSLRLDAPAAIEAYPNQPFPYLLAGIAFNESKEPQKASEFLEDGLAYVLRNEQLQLEFHLQLAAAYHQLEEHDQSDENFDLALEINPRHPTALNNYAYYLSLRGERLDKALEMTQLSNRLSPNNPVFLDTWAWVLHRMDRNQEALAKIEECLKLSRTVDPELREHYAAILQALGRGEEAAEQRALISK